MVSAIIFKKWHWLSLGLFVPIAALPLVKGDLSDGLTLFITPLTIGLVAGWALLKGKSLTVFLITSVLCFSTLFVVEYQVIRQFKGYDMLKVARDGAVLMLDKSDKELDEIFAGYKSNESEKKILREEFRRTVSMLKEEKWLHFFRDMLPFISFLYGLFASSLSFYLIRRFFTKDLEVKSKALEFFKLNDYTIFALIAGWAGVIFLNKNLFPGVSMVFLNIALITSVLYMIQALGIIKFKLLKRGWPTYILPLAIFASLTFSSSAIIFMAVILTGIGTLDLWADFRKLVPKIEEKEE